MLARSSPCALTCHSRAVFFCLSRPSCRHVAATPSSRQKLNRTAYIALGSNLGDRVASIERACNEMDQRGIRVRRTSSLWETEPMYVLDQARFLNGACEVDTDLDPLALLDELQDIEKMMGREKTIDKGPRNIDLDIMLYDDQKIHHERLTVPHAGLLEREFMLRPLAELVPGKQKQIDPSRPQAGVQELLDHMPPSDSPPTSLFPLSPATAAPLTPSRRDRRTRLMAILNVTPDSFSDGGAHVTHHDIKRAVLSFVREGAAIVDVGGQSTRPGAPQVSAEEETGRVVDAIRAIRSLPEAAHVPISIDTYRASVAEAACAAGADMINDVSAGVLDPGMLPAAARLGKTLILMHMRGDPTTMAGLRAYPDGPVVGVATELRARVAAAESAGVRRWRLMLDPGLGFAKAGAQNTELLRRLDELRESEGLRGLPWLVGPSRKSFIGAATGVEDPAKRVWGTAAAVSAAVAGGADVVRVHDVSEMARVVSMADAIWRGQGYSIAGW